MYKMKIETLETHTLYNEALNFALVKTIITDGDKKENIKAELKILELKQKEYPDRKKLKEVFKDYIKEIEKII